ncbi:hypothetical protein GGS20DRAFT_587474 [Poronia punctata]|nr:hypothetical protein GGS20DRAFT_587474 [Poronia punctata]
MATPGLLHVTARVCNTEAVPDDLFNWFHDEEHLGAMLAGGYSDLALRYKNVDSSPNSNQYLTLYIVKDAAYLGSREHERQIKKTMRSEILQTDDITKLIDFELTAYTKLRTYPRHGVEPRWQVETLFCLYIEPAGQPDAGLDEEWYLEHRGHMFARCKALRRITWYLRNDGVSPRFLILHELDCKCPKDSAKEIANAIADSSRNLVLGKSKVYIQEVYTLIGAQVRHGTAARGFTLVRGNGIYQIVSEEMM